MCTCYFYFLLFIKPQVVVAFPAASTAAKSANPVLITSLTCVSESAFVKKPTSSKRPVAAISPGRAPIHIGDSFLTSAPPLAFSPSHFFHQQNICTFFAIINFSNMVPCAISNNSLTFNTTWSPVQHST